MWKVQQHSNFSNVIWEFTDTSRWVQYLISSLSCFELFGWV
jgi:hypothetical protein